MPGSWLRQGLQVSLYLLKGGESRTAGLSSNVQVSIREGSECEFHRKSRRSKSRSIARYGRPKKIKVNSELTQHVEHKQSSCGDGREESRRMQRMPSTKRERGGRE